jgi:hypothetical protein
VDNPSLRAVGPALHITNIRIKTDGGASSRRASSRIVVVISRSRKRDERPAGLPWRRPVDSGASVTGGPCLLPA